MATLDVICLPGVKPDELLGLQLHLLEAVGNRLTPAVLLLYQLDGHIISIGRYHAYGGSPGCAGIGAYRRLSGGRIVNGGAGCFGAALILPSRAAMLTDRDQRLRPDQVINRHARGALGALRDLGADCFYPGRDAITCERRELGMCTFEETAGRALLLELLIAVDRGLDSLPFDLERFDPDGRLVCPLYTDETATCLTRELKRNISFSELTDRVAAGYGSVFGGTRRRELSGEEITAARTHGRALAASNWLNYRYPGPRHPGPDLNLHSRASIQLGFIEARMRRAGDRIERIAFYGDFIANSAGLAEFEQLLAGKRLDLVSLTAATMEHYADGTNFFLGIGDLITLPALILKAS